MQLLKIEANAHGCVGMAHSLQTLSRPNHLVALAPFCIGRSRLQSFSVSTLWAYAHDASQIFFGLTFQSFKD
jgi:hypothetical protein